MAYPPFAFLDYSSDLLAIVEKTLDLSTVCLRKPSRYGHIAQSKQTNRIKLLSSPNYILHFTMNGKVGNRSEYEKT